MTSDESRGELISPLELFHPDGAVKGVLVDGDARVGVALPVGVSGAGRVDLLVVGPSREQWRSRRWLAHLLDDAFPELAADAIVYLVTPPFRRRRARRALKRNGLRVVAAVAHVPSSRSSRYLVSLDRPVASRAFASVVAVWPRRRRVLAVVLRLPGAARLLEPVLPSLALVAQRPEARPPCEWVSRLTDDGTDRRAVVVVTSGHTSDDRLVVLSLPSRKGCAHVVGKVRRGGSTALGQEAANLSRIGAHARVAGARVPEALVAQPLPGRSVLIETGLPGQSAAALLASRPRAFARVLALLADWLEAWNRATLVVRAPEPQELERLVLGPAELLAGELEAGAEYVTWLADRCRRVAEGPVPFVTAHNDLTMFNLLVDDGRLGIVDWEAADDAQLPLTDFVYAVADAAAATARYADRARAVEECFLSTGRHAVSVAPLQHRLMSAVGVSAEVAELSFHACWLHHAANEHRSDDALSDRPFLAIVERLVAMREAWPATFRT
jgi:hypothetical protein